MDINDLPIFEDINKMNETISQMSKQQTRVDNTNRSTSSVPIDSNVMDGYSPIENGKFSHQVQEQYHHQQQQQQQHQQYQQEQQYYQDHYQQYEHYQPQHTNIYEGSGIVSGRSRSIDPNMMMTRRSRHDSQQQQSVMMDEMYEMDEFDQMERGRIRMMPTHHSVTFSNQNYSYGSYEQQQQQQQQEIHHHHQQQQIFQQQQQQHQPTSNVRAHSVQGIRMGRNHEYDYRSNEPTTRHRSYSSYPHRRLPMNPTERARYANEW